MLFWMWRHEYLFITLPSFFWYLEIGSWIGWFFCFHLHSNCILLRVTLVSLVMVPFSVQGFQFSYMLNNMCCLLMHHPCWDVMVLFYVFWVLSHQQSQCHEDFFLFSMRSRISNLVFESSIHYKLILFTCPFLWRSSSLASFIEEPVYRIQNGLNPLSRVRQLRNNRHVDTCTKNRK